METTTTLDLGAMTIGLLGGIALFLYGVEKMTDALRAVAGEGLKDLLARAATSRIRGLISGTLVTAAIQSSSVTTVLLVGFISAGLMTLEQSVPLILGANVGTTLSAQLIAFSVTKYGLLLLGLGFLVGTLARRASARQWGWMLMGLGMLFFGMDLMNGAMYPLRSYEPFIEFMKTMERPFLGFLVGAAFTGLVQSSLATTGIVIVLASQGFVTLEAGIPLILGANVGTCVTAVLASFGKAPAARQAAILHVLFNTIGALAWLPFVGALANLARAISPEAAGLEGAARLAEEVPRQVANAHTIFNVANTLIALPFTGALAALAKRLAPDRPGVPTVSLRPIHLDPAFLGTPALAIDAARREVWRMAQEASRVVRDAPRLMRSGAEDDAAVVHTLFENVETLHDAVSAYLSRLMASGLIERDAAAVQRTLEIAHYVRSAAEVIENDVAAILREAGAPGAAPSQETAQMLADLHQRVAALFDDAIRAAREEDRELASRTIEAKAEVDAQVEQARRHLLSRLTADAPNRALLFRLEESTIDHVERVYSLAHRIARVAAAA